ncbi:MAG: PepSY domain-containing protein [Myxococcales bacterium]|nr:PepSY domain-containing protein [Myxococcales bacterium]MCB9712284.1 PepSY domain-containing protein [Myxococcales bacterium]
MRRRSWFRLHQWTGLGVALLLLLSAATGLVLLFRDQLSPPRPSAPEVVRPLPLEQLVDRAVAVGDGSPATDIGLPQAPDQPYTVWLDDDAETEVYLAGDGRVLGTRQGVAGLTRLLFRLHTGELLGPAGTLLMLLAGLGLLILVGSGLSMLWARTVARRGRRRSGPRGADKEGDTR